MREVSAAEAPHEMADVRVVGFTVVVTVAFAVAVVIKWRQYNDLQL